jgi:6-phosphogluconolactonase/glucosamine-6-phosphate isomerase/deaminase
MEDKRVNIALTAGNSPKGTYELFIRKVKANPKDYGHVHFYSFDEVPRTGSDKGYTISGLDELFFKPAGIDPARIHPITCENYAVYPKEIADAGGLDFMLIGLGGDGHFCGNMPLAVKFDEYAYRIAIEKKYEWYKTFTALCGKEPVPESFVTLGAASIMKVRRLVMIVNGRDKVAAVRRFLEGSVDTAFPASILKLHPNFTVIVDREAFYKSNP